MGATWSEASFNPDPTESLDATSGGAGMPELPDDFEARCWLLAEREQKTQAEIAALMQKSQPTVHRAIASAARKINEIVRLKWIDRERLEQHMRNAVGLAPRT